MTDSVSYSTSIDTCTPLRQSKFVLFSRLGEKIRDVENYLVATLVSSLIKASFSCKKNILQIECYFWQFKFRDFVIQNSLFSICTCVQIQNQTIERIK